MPLQGWEFEENVTDIYLFLPAGNYRNFSSDFVSLTGQSEMVELKTFGQWDSRYYAYNEQTALQQIKDYQEKGFAIDVLVVDTDWRDASGGFGYDINTTLFPDMERFLEEAHKLGVNVCFNDHPQPNGGNNLLDKEEVAYRSQLFDTVDGRHRRAGRLAPSGNRGRGVCGRGAGHSLRIRRYRRA